MIQRTARPAIGGMTVLLALMPVAAAQAQSSAPSSVGEWRYSMSVYGYFPSLSGSTSAPTTPGGPTIDVSAGEVLDALKFTFMGNFNAHNGRFGFFTDFIYLDLGGSRQGTRDFTINHVPISASTRPT